MKRLIAAIFAIVLLPTVGYGKGKDKLKVTVVENIPSMASYTWRAEGHNSAPCTGGSCESNYESQASGSKTFQRAHIKLLLPDGRIAVATCTGRIAVGMGMALSGQATAAVSTACQAPKAGTILDADFHGNMIMLHIEAVSIDGSGKRYAVIYNLEGVLQPTADPKQ
jgi:hypothetical protein